MSNPNGKPDVAILDVEMATHAIIDNKFYEQLPEFLTMRKRIEQTHAINLGGCTTCAARRVAASIMTSFASLVASLDEDAGDRMCRYFNKDMLVIRYVDPNTRSNGVATLKRLA